jgi:hypothetical protein
MKIEIASATKEETAYDKWIIFNYEGQEYSVLLHWDKWDGFDLQFTESEFRSKWIADPEWASEWQENPGYEESLECTLDNLTDEVLEASYL